LLFTAENTLSVEVQVGAAVGASIIDSSVVGGAVGIIFGISDGLGKRVGWVDWGVRTSLIFWRKIKLCCSKEFFY
jgi:hypothetical protein